jgi:DNA-binding MarR family transcriptional regulator
MSAIKNAYTRHLRKRCDRPLTPRQRHLLTQFAQLQVASGGPPTIRALGEAIGVKGTNGVVVHLLALARKGYVLPPDPGESRLCWRLSDKGVAEVRGVTGRWPYVRICLIDPEVTMRPDEAREFAAKILAAADAVERDD